MKHLIEQQSQLKELESIFMRLRDGGGQVAVDTEFLREKTYNAKLCLVQLGIGEDQYCIDVLTVGDLRILSELFADERVLKLFHAAKQDMEVLFQLLEVMPKPIFDTQLAAAFTGMDMQIGYAALVQLELGIELPKSQARTDWTRRPLTPDQLEYAAHDVEYLPALYEQGIDKLKEQGKVSWYQQEIAGYYDPQKYVTDPAKAYQRLSGGSLNIAQQYTLKALAEWRERTAQAKDIPRSWVLRDEMLFDLAARQPGTVDEIKKLGVFGRKSVHRLAPIAARLIAAVEVGSRELWNRVEPLNKQEKGICNAMMKELAKYAKQQEVAQGLLATRKDIEALFRYQHSEKLMSGWRRDVIGKRLLEFVASQIA